MNSYYTMWVISILCVLIGQGCSKNNPLSQNPIPPTQVSVPSASTITSGSTSNNASMTEAKIKNTLQILNSIKFNKSMFDFSSPENVKALDERNKMVSTLMKEPSVLQREDVKTALINLFNNQTQYATEYIQANPDKGLGEAYGETGPNLGGLMIKYLDKRSLYTEIVLLGDTHAFLTTYWKESSQLVLQRIKDLSNSTPLMILHTEDSILRQIAALGKAQKEKNFTLDRTTVESFKIFAFTELKSNEFFIREAAVKALQYISTKRDKEIIGALKTVTKSDPYKYGGIPIEYPVREAAQRALEYIEKQ